METLLNLIFILTWWWDTVYYVVIQIYLWLKILTLYLELFPFASDYGNKTEKKKKKKVTKFDCNKYLKYF